MNTRTWIVTGSLATVVATGGVAAAMADSNDDRDLDAVTVNGPQVSAPSPAGTGMNAASASLSALTAGETVSANSPATTMSIQTAISAQSAQSAQTTVSAPSPISAPSAPSPEASPMSPASPVSPASADSGDSAPSAESGG